MDGAKCFVSYSFFAPAQITKIKICHMVASKYPGVIEERQRFIATGVLDPEESSEDGVIDYDGDALDKE